MNAQELAKFIAQRYRDKYLVRRLGDGEFTKRITRDLQDEVVLCAVELGLPSFLGGVVLPVQSSSEKEELRISDNAEYFHDLAFDSDKVFYRAGDDWKPAPKLFLPRRVLRFLIERPNLTFTVNDLQDNDSSRSGSWINSSNLCCQMVRELPKYSRVYRGMREGRNPTRYGVRELLQG